MLAATDRFYYSDYWALIKAYFLEFVFTPINPDG